MKNPLTPAGIEPATFRIVAQHLNHCATAVPHKCINCLKITGITNSMFRAQKTVKKTRIKLCSSLALPALVYGSENWTIKARVARRITGAEVKYKRKTAG